MKRFILALACAAASVAVPVAQSPAPATSEPHHKRLLYTNDVRVFDVVVPPGQTAADHVHEFDLATVVLGDGALGVNRNGQALATGPAMGPGSVTITEQSGVPATFRIQNTGTTDFHVLEVENMRADGKWLMPPLMMAAGTSVTAQSRAFAVYDVRLHSGEETRHEHAWSTIAVVIDGTVEQGGIGGEEPARLGGRGRWLTLPRAQVHTLTAIDGDAHVVEVEAR
jgi:quercetin dioxygenase-like cupin family protein